MLIKPLSSVTKFIEEATDGSYRKVSERHKLHVSFWLTAILITGAFKVKAIARFTLNQLTANSIFALLKRGSVPLMALFWGAIKLVIKKYGLVNVVIVIDDSNRTRSKNCRKLPGVSKTKCKETGGWVMAQNYIFICLVTDRITIPIWFGAYKPSEIVKKIKEDDKKNGRPKRKFTPSHIKALDKNYRTKTDIALIGIAWVARLLQKLRDETGEKIKIKCCAADCAFSSPKIQRTIRKKLACPLVAKMRENAKVVPKGEKKGISVTDYFADLPSKTTEVSQRGKKENIEYKSGVLHVKAFGRKVSMVASRTKEDRNWRYIFVSDLGWEPETILNGYSFRWIIEVFFRDWKQHDGWGRGGMQRSAKGMIQGIYLSLIADLFLLYYQDLVFDSHHNGREIHLNTAGNVVKTLQSEAIIEVSKELVESDKPDQLFEAYKTSLREMNTFTRSLKHSQDQWSLSELKSRRSDAEYEGMEADQQDEQDEFLESKLRKEANEIEKFRKKEASLMVGLYSQKEEPFGTS